MKIKITGPDGKKYQIGVAEGADPDATVEQFGKDMGWPTPKGPATSALGTAGVTLGSIGAQFNEGLAQSADMIPQVGRWIRRQFDSSIPPLEAKDPAGVRTALRGVGVPVGDLASQKWEHGVEEGPVRRIAGTAAKIAGQSAPFIPMGPVAPGIKSTALAAGLGTVGREVGGDVGETAGVLASLPLAFRGAAPRVPKAQATESILAEAGKHFDDFAGSPAAVTKKSFGRLAQTVESRLRAEPILTRELHPKSVAVFEAIVDKLGTRNVQGMTMGDLWGIRRLLNKEIPRAGADDARVLMGIKKDVNQYLKGLTQADALFGDVPKAAKNLQLGITKYAKGAQAKEIDDLIREAKLHAQKHRSVSVDQALRNKFFSIAKDEDELRRFSPPVQEAIKKVAAGEWDRNLLTFLGRFDPTSKVMPALAAGSAAAFGGVPETAALIGTPLFLSRLASNAMARRDAKAVSELIRRGYPAPPRRPAFGAAPAAGGAILGQRERR